ncbi:hypothetical protein NEAUS05_0228 [Nematocida ausubeli]|nr:hypothetical protein NEAUS06_1332 [Nematocida ausubeli]KAI5146789.1 hypothetical protein NEAUS05_0228 [Nematocida ausubeli]
MARIGTFRKTFDVLLMIIGISAVLYIAYYVIYDLNIYKGKNKELRKLFNTLSANKAKSFNTFMKEQNVDKGEIIACLSENVKIERRLTAKIINSILDKKVNRWFFLERRINKMLKTPDREKLLRLLERKEGLAFTNLLDNLVHTIVLDLDAIEANLTS